MKQNSISLTMHIWSHLAIFLTLIIAFLWIFQVLFFDIYYERRTTSLIEKLALKTKIYYERAKEVSYYDELSYENNACIQIIRDGETIYTTKCTRR